MSVKFSIKRKQTKCSFRNFQIHLTPASSSEHETYLYKEMFKNAINYITIALHFHLQLHPDVNGNRRVRLLLHAFNSMFLLPFLVLNLCDVKRESFHEMLKRLRANRARKRNEKIIQIRSLLFYFYGVSIFCSVGAFVEM